MRNKENKKEMKETTKKIIKIIKIALFIAMLILIYTASPRITQVIQDTAKYIHELDPNQITQAVEIVLAVSLVSIVAFIKNKKGE